MAEFPYLPFWTDAYLGDTTHLTTIEHGAFLLLLMTSWRAKTHDLPDDDRMLARYTRLNLRQWKRIRPIIEPLFKVTSGRWSNQRLLDELDAVRRHIGQRSNAGKSSALKRKHRGSTTVQRGGNGEATPTPTPTPISNTLPIGTRISSSWKPSPETLQWAALRGIQDSTINEQAEIFINHYKADASERATKADWDASFRKWMLSGDKRKKNGNGNGSHKGKRTIFDAGMDWINEEPHGKEQQNLIDRNVKLIPAAGGKS